MNYELPALLVCKVILVDLPLLIGFYFLERPISRRR